jgi:hypothetical protein
MLVCPRAGPHRAPLGAWQCGDGRDRVPIACLRVARSLPREGQREAAAEDLLGEGGSERGAGQADVAKRLFPAPLGMGALLFGRQDHVGGDHVP